MYVWKFALAGVLCLASHLALATPIVTFAVNGGPTFSQNSNASTVPDQIEAFVGSAFTPTGGITAKLFVAGYDGCDVGGLLGALSDNYIVVVQRGACSFASKALNASWVGALALVVVDNVAPSTLDGASIVGGPSIPSIFGTLDVGLALAGLDRQQATLTISPGPSDPTTIAEPSTTVVFAAGLLSVLLLTIQRGCIAQSDYLKSAKWASASWSMERGSGPTARATRSRPPGFRFGV